jgi:hypothetical protein
MAGEYLPSVTPQPVQMNCRITGSLFSPEIFVVLCLDSMCTHTASSFRMTFNSNLKDVSYLNDLRPATQVPV